MSQRYSRWELDTIKHLRKQHVSLKEIARKLGRSYAATWAIAKKIGATARPVPDNPKFRIVCDLYERGEKVEIIAATAGVGTGTVSRWARIGNVSPRGRGHRLEAGKRGAVLIRTAPNHLLTRAL